MRFRIIVDVEGGAESDPSRYEDEEQYVRGAIEVGDDGGAISIVSIRLEREELDEDLELPDLDDELGLEED